MSFSKLPSSRVFLSLGFFLICFALAANRVQSRSPPSTADLKSLFYEFINEVDDMENDDGAEYLEDYKELEADEPQEKNWFRRERKSMRCSFHNLCYCRSRMTGNRFCCDCAAGPCFPGSSTVTVEGLGSINMSDLQIGQRVLSGTTTGELVYSRVVAFLDRRPRGQAEYINLIFGEGQKISISATHLIFASNNNVSYLREAKFASAVQIGDILFSRDNNGSLIKPVTVVNITRKVQEGAYVPLTEQGTIVVDDVLSSCYASYGHEVSHFFLAPVRWFPSMFNMATSQPNGVMRFVSFLKVVGQVLSSVPGLVQSSQSEVDILLFPNIVTKQQSISQN